MKSNSSYNSARKKNVASSFAFAAFLLVRASRCPTLRLPSRHLAGVPLPRCYEIQFSHPAAFHALRTYPSGRPLRVHTKPFSRSAPPPPEFFFSLFSPAARTYTPTNQVSRALQIEFLRRWTMCCNCALKWLQR